MIFATATGVLLALLLVHQLPVLPLAEALTPVWLLMGIGGLLGLTARHPATMQKQALLCVVAGMLFGLGYAHWRAELRLNESLPPAWESRDITLDGFVTNLPQPFNNSYRPGQRFEFSVTHVVTAGAHVPSHLRLVWYGNVPAPPEDDASDEETSPPEQTLKPGQRWRLTVRLKRPHGNANPGGFDYEGWLFAHDIRATGYVRGPVTADSPKYLGEQPWAFSLWIEQLRLRLRLQLFKVLPPENHPNAGILAGLAIGDQSAIPDEAWQLFNRTGLTHLMVVSGSHITLFAGLVGWLAFRFWCCFPGLVLRLPAQRFAALAGWLTAFFYTWLSGLGIPALRTLLMLTVAAIALFQHRHVRPAQTLSFSLFAVLLFDPWAPLAPGFWLSFITVAALLVVADRSHPSQRLRWLFEGIRSQWAATLATFPLLLLFFQNLSLVSPLANAIAIPLIGLVITPLTLLGTCLLAVSRATPVLTDVAYGPLWLADQLLSLLMGVLPGLSEFPTWQAPTPPWWATALAVVGVALLLLPRGVPGRLTLGVFSLLPALFWPATHPNPGEFWADVLDVGQGQAVLIRTHEHALLYDSGPRYGTASAQNASPPDAAQRVILPFLRAEGVRRLDTLLVSHKDSDHAGGTDTLKHTLPVGMVLSPKVHPDDALCQQGLNWTWSGVRFEVLHPLPDMLNNPPKNTNAVSCVLRVSSSTQSLLLTGDLPEKEEIALVHNGQPLRSQVLVAPHHGSKTSSSKIFLQAVQPETVIISAGYRNRFGHPHPDVLQRYADQQLGIWRTDQQGAIQVRPTGITAWRQTHQRYWQDSPAP